MTQSGTILSRAAPCTCMDCFVFFGFLCFNVLYTNEIFVIETLFVLPCNVLKLSAANVVARQRAIDGFRRVVEILYVNFERDAPNE